MKEVLEFIFQDVWHFLGTCILLEIVFDRPFISISNIKDKINKS